MIITVPLKTDKYGEYCVHCYVANPIHNFIDGIKSFSCATCGQTHDRLLIIDPTIKSWIDDAKRYCHESVGIILINAQHQILFYELTKFPYDYTIPAGHVDLNETLNDAVTRETLEEVGVDIRTPKLVANVMISGDSCRRGCDDHLWSLYAQHVTAEESAGISVDEKEGKKPTWVNIHDVQSLKLTFAMSFLFTKYKKVIEDIL
jgi:ADP-ribose pyrophosphatase YjhB (NUDIX family)